MAYDFEESSGQRITYTPNADYATKVAISCWIKAESNPGAHQTHFVDKGDAASGGDRNISMAWTPASGGRWFMSFSDASNNYSEWTAAGSPTTGTWQNLYLEVDWSTNPDTFLFWVDGSAVTLSNSFGSNNATPSNDPTQQISIGGEHGSADNTNNADGLIAEVAFWNDNIGAARATMLSKGFSPLFFKNNLKEYIPLTRNLHNLKGGTGTLSSSNPVVADHPRIIYPRSLQIRNGTAGAAAATSVKDLIGGFGIIPFAR